MDSMKERIEALRAIPLFASLEEPVLEEIAGLLIDRKFPKDAIVFEEGSVGDYMYLIREGQVKVTKMSEDGREKILEIFNAGNFFGDMALLERELAQQATRAPLDALEEQAADLLVRLAHAQRELAHQL